MKIPRTKAALFGDTGPGGENLDQIYGSQRLKDLERHAELYPTVVTTSNLEACLPDLADIQVIFSTWGMFPLTDVQLDQLPSLRAVFYAAGSVRGFATPFLERGITVVSGWCANAVPVAELTLGQILLAGKGYFRNVREYHDAADYTSAFRGRGNYGNTVAVLGAGQIGRKLIELLRPFRFRVLAFDPFLSYKAADELGVEKVGLNEAFAMGDIVTNHLANVPETVGLLQCHHFCCLPQNATFINTGRGPTVDHEALASVLKARPDLTALLDVTEPEPLPSTSPLRVLPNVYISAHIAGSIGDEVGRLADTVLEEFANWEAGLPLRYAVTPQMLECMA